MKALIIILLFISGAVMGQDKKIEPPKEDTTKAILILKDRTEDYIPAFRIPGYVIKNGKYWKRYLDNDKKPILKYFSIREYHF